MQLKRLRSLALMSALTVASFARAAAPSFHWDVPKVVEDIDIPGQTVAMGIPVRLHAKRSAERMSDLIDYFLDSFHRAKLWVRPPLPVLPGAVEIRITGLDTRTRIAYTVILQPNADKTTTVILGEANLAARQSGAGSDFAPVYPGARNVIRSNSELAKLISYDVDAPLRDVDRFYAEQLAKFGYRPIEPGLYQRGNQQIRVNTSVSDGRVQVSVFERDLSAVEQAAPSANP